MESLLYSILFLPMIVFYGGYTTIAICHYLNKEFYHPTMTITDVDTLKMRALPSLAFSGTLTYLYHKKSDNVSHSWFYSSLIMASYVILVELCYYVYHRTVHTKPFLKVIHENYHSKINTYPIDFLNLSFIDSFFYVACLHIPTYILPMNLNEFFIGIYFFTTLGFIMHSDIITNAYTIHHRNLNCNYCLLFPIFDKWFATYRISKIEIGNYLVKVCEMGLIELNYRMPSICQNQYYDNIMVSISSYNKNRKAEEEISKSSKKEGDDYIILDE
uniref:Fatty acid hydroxylase domain-containing protein n=1 Tax=viral metagenome TaxID=1070528 RepID=A0A6C0DPY3_9ZZZZ